ncbi:hypothetical protein [Streptomyces sp. NPDC015414]|uniref:hypothetical protein n=1 Tax=Streptomyces sp. NPDC015414 TaxID=3364957 RepID=UPI0036FBF443
MDTLRRLPQSMNRDGRTEYVTPGTGIVNRIADTFEETALANLRDRLKRAENLVNDRDASSSEMRAALRLTIAEAREVLEVATLRGERLETLTPESDE